MKSDSIYKEKSKGILSRINIFSKASRNEKLANEILWAQIFNSTITNSLWLRDKSFSPGRWAVGYPMLYIMYRVLNDVKPISILEFGLGESSKMTYQYEQFAEKSKLKIIEQDKEWLSFFSQEKFDVRSFVSLHPIVQKRIGGSLVNIYEGLLPELKNEKYDFIIIDGPWGSERNSRPQIIDILKNGHLDDNFVILMDDYNRRGEQDTVREIFRELQRQKIDYVFGVYSGMKDTAIICSSKLKFLTTL